MEVLKYDGVRGIIQPNDAFNQYITLCKMVDKINKKVVTVNSKGEDVSVIADAVIVKGKTSWADRRRRLMAISFGNFGNSSMITTAKNGSILSRTWAKMTEDDMVFSVVLHEVAHLLPGDTQTHNEAYYQNLFFLWDIFVPLEKRNPFLQKEINYKGKRIFKYYLEELERKSKYDLEQPDRGDSDPHRICEG